jgi:hypothetical protein
MWNFYVRQTHFEVHFKIVFGFLQILYLKDERDTHSLNTSLVAVDFMSTNLTEVLFNNNCDLYRSEFESNRRQSRF